MTPLTMTLNTENTNTDAQTKLKNELTTKPTQIKIPVNEKPEKDFLLRLPISPPLLLGEANPKRAPDPNVLSQNGLHIKTSFSLDIHFVSSVHHGVLSPKVRLWIYKHFQESSVCICLLLQFFGCQKF